MFCFSFLLVCFQTKIFTRHVFSIETKTKEKRRIKIVKIYVKIRYPNTVTVTICFL